MTVSSLQKACKDMPGGLTLEEIGDLTSVEAQMNQINRVNPFYRSSKLHTHSQNERSDHKFCFPPKHHDDSNRNIPPTVQPLVSQSSQKHRGRPKSHLSTSSRLYHINRKVLKSYSHFSSEEHLSHDSKVSSLCRIISLLYNVKIPLCTASQIHCLNADKSI